MHSVARLGNWIKSHRKPVVAHSLILVGFVLYSLFLAKPLFNRFEKIPDEARQEHMQLPTETNNVKFNIDHLVVSPSALEIDGWAFINGYGDEHDRTFIVLKSAKTSYIFDTFNVFDNPVTFDYGGPSINLDWSGFTATIPIRLIEKGDYILGFYITKDGIMALQYSKKIISKSDNEIKLIESP
jgi:hypothetical protein